MFEEQKDIAAKIKSKLFGVHFTNVAQRIGITPSALYYQLTGKSRLKEKTIRESIKYLEELKQKEKEFLRKLETL